MDSLAKRSKLTMPAHAVRTRRAYFDCRFGQLHVRTAFPTTGGFDEQVPLFCLHPDRSSSRSFARFLPEIADVRSVYAPDLPGLGESDPSPTPTSSVADAAGAVSDLADDLRLKQIDLLGIHGGARVALDLAAARPQLVRRLVLVGVLGADRLPTIKQSTLMMRTPREPSEGMARLKTALPNGRFIEIAEYADDLFDASPITLAGQIGAFLSG
ncbi:MAG TPA: alpha/beta fold hydrolase [Steroidobacteraceae bacterium]|jgi:pimeloyl-ACP methyl ester carboxylesterase|nr:alpha/beta fold hydrolase [Steroidobacteraceae bacterium]